MAAPNGTCYLASDQVGAMRETLGPDYEAVSIVNRSFFDKRRHWRLVPLSAGWSRGLARLRSDWWNHLQLTNAIFTLPVYAMPQRWASRFHEAGWDGLLGQLRHVMDTSRYGVALFGPSGPQASDTRFDVDVDDYDSAAFSEFRTETGIEVHHSPAPKGAMHVIS